MVRPSRILRPWSSTGVEGAHFLFIHRLKARARFGSGRTGDASPTMTGMPLTAATKIDGACLHAKNENACSRDCDTLFN